MSVGHIAIGEKVRALREGMGLTQQALAKKAGVNKKLISKMENGKRTMLTFIGYVAEVLGVECGDILKQDASEASPTSASKDRPLMVKLTLQVEIEDLDEAEEYIEMLKQVFRSKHPCPVVEIDAGSLIASLNVVYDDLVQLIYQFCRREFDEFHLKEVRIFNINTYDLTIAEIAIRLRTLSDALETEPYVYDPDGSRAEWFQLLESYNHDARSTAPGHDELTRLSQQPDFTDIIEWLKHSEGRRILESSTWLDWLESRKEPTFPNTSVRVLNDGSVTLRAGGAASNPRAGASVR